MTREEKFIESLYDEADEDLKEVYKEQKQNRDELLQAIAMIILTYTVLDGLMSLKSKDKRKEYKRLSKLIINGTQSQKGTQTRAINNILGNTVKNTFNFYSYNANLKDVKKIVDANFKGKHFSERVWTNEKAVGEHLHKQVKQFLDGKINVNQIKKDIEKTFNTNAYNAKRLVETEVARCSSNAFDRFCIETGVKKVRYNATLDKRLCADCEKHHDQVFDFDKKIELPRHALCRCFYTIEDDSYKKDVSKIENSGIISNEELFRREYDIRENLKFVSDTTFDKLTIKARKNGALIVRGNEEVEEHLNDLEAAAANIGDVLLFRKDVCISEVLEETYHFEQNLKKQNDDKAEPLRSILNEIDAKEYLLNNSKKYKIPRNEITMTKKQLEYYKNKLKEVMRGE
ncbi:phage minor head protein [Clostridium sp. KNHs214]|uniref:phage minor head protein n=1 Tax=Clostridium sp. KNHs214 TaxID=1540257 RepID=UPI0009DCEAEB|nr:phage minor head protein [Clostridium sp. KNHs214]